VRNLTRDEKLAIAAMRRVARRWPSTLALRHMGSERGDLHVTFNETGVDPIERETVAVIKGFHLDSTS
jgi:hypothetical protein